MSDGELRAKYGLSARGFVSLIKALLARGTINQEDLVTRKEMAVQRDLAKEHEFLAQLYICPHCGHPHPTPYDRCPACGADTSDAFGTADGALDPLTSTGRHFYPDSPGAERDAEENVSHEGSAPATEGETATTPQDTASPFKTVRSLISKFTKK